MKEQERQNLIHLWKCYMSKGDICEAEIIRKRLDKDPLEVEVKPVEPPAQNENKI